MVEYVVAQHHFVIQADNILPIERLLSSFTPFRCHVCTDKPKLFGLTVSNHPIDVAIGEKIIGFDMNQAYCSVYTTVGGDNVFEILPKNGDKLYTMVANMNFSQAEIYLFQQYDNQTIFVLNNVLMMLYAFASARFSTLLFHGSVVVRRDLAYMFVAKSGGGKSTHSKLWLSTIGQCELLNDDNPVVRVIDGRVVVYGSPWSGKTRCYENRSAVLKSIVHLSQAPSNSIAKCGAVQAFAVILPSVSQLQWDRSIHDGVCSSIVQVLERVSVFSLNCLPNPQAARICYEAMC